MNMMCDHAQSDALSISIAVFKVIVEQMRSDATAEEALRFLDSIARTIRDEHFALAPSHQQAATIAPIDIERFRMVVRRLGPENNVYPGPVRVNIVLPDR
ncbi:MAG: hypothetical protein JNL19_12380 [Burkholderiales bacterium]|nr:hypothetical protein [Burkholderiales bacterium]